MSMQQTNSGAESGAASYAMSGASATRRASGAVRGDLGFYSALASAIEGCKQGEAAAQGWSDLIKGLVNKGLAKQDEVEWTGLEDWLSLQDGRISKEQVLDYLEQHGVQVVEDRLAAGNKEWFVRDRSSLEVIESGFESEDAAQIWAEDNLGTSFREQYKILQNDESTGDARYGDYTQRGGTNYREIILRLPESRVLPQRERFSLFHGGTLIAQGMWPPSRRTQESLATNPNLRVQREWVPDQNEARRQGVYLPTHWAQTNVLAHLRLTDRVGVDGRQVLFVEEIQSDWAQDGRRNGFAQKTQGKASGADGSVPVGPFVTKTEGWLSLALKRVLVMAAEGGYEAVAFISGEQSAARYKLAQPIDRAAITRTGGVWAVTAWHKDSAAITRDVTTDAALRELVGKELAARAIAEGGGEYKGLNLSFGGNGMRAFYDTIVPNTLKALLKKLGIDAPMQAIKLQGANAEMAAFPAGEKWVVTDAEDGRIEHGKFATLKEAMDFMRGAASQQVSLPVTEALRERVRTGMPLFSRKGRTQGVTPSAAANEPPTGSESKSIEDAGEKIGGARKDRWRERGLNLDDLNSMSINAAFEGLIKTIKVQETERGVMLFEPDAEYADEDERITRISHPVTDDQLLQKFLDEGPVESQTGSAAKASQREAASAVKDIRSTATPLGRVLSRDYAARQRINLVGQKIESAQDLAVLAQVYRDPRFETFRVLFVNDVGDVVSQVGLTSRLPASVQVIMGDDMDAYLAELSTAARSSGATGYYLLHNHPSGVATPSQADINLTKQFATKMPGLNLHWHVVIDTNEYACIDGDGEFESIKIDLGQPALFTAPEWDDLNISGPKDVMAVAKRLQADQGAVTLIHTDSQHKVRFVDTIPPSVAMSDQETVRRHVLKVSLRHGGAKVFAVSRNKLALARMSDLIVDGIHVSDLGHTWSMMENGAMPGGQLFPQTRRARLSPDTSPGFAYLRSTPSSARQMDAKDPGLKTVDQINSGSFKRWFGDSKVVDANGKPLVVYHGTDADITEFKVSERGTYGGGIYLTPDTEGANDYAIYRGSKNPTVYPLYVSIKNPATGAEAARVASWKGEENARAELIARGYDGVIDARSGEIVAFYPEQIKSAIGNRGTFDPTNPDIRFSRTKAKEIRNLVTRESRDQWSSLLNKYRFEAYKRLAGEVEARNTQARQGMTDEQRRATPPSATQDVPDADVIVMFDGKVAENAPMPANIRASRGRRGTMTESAVRQVANAIAARWARAPTIVVVPNMQDPRVPEAARAEDARQREAGATGVPRGFYHRGTVYLVADGMKSVSDVVEALFHEALGHYGLRALFGAALNDILNQIAMARPDLMRPKADEYGKDLKNLKQRREVAEEVLAGMSQTKPNIGFVKRAIAAIRTWLRQNVPALKDMALTDAEIIQNYILPARGWVERGERAMRPGGQVALLRAYHGTPHRGIQKFSTDFIGTGEGAQAYGWGIYLASHRDVAEHYRKSVSDNRGSRFSIAGNMPTSANEGLSNGEAMATKDLSKLFVPDTKIVQTFGSLDVVSQGRVLGMVRRLIQNREVLQTVVGLVPVDVVNMLSRGQLATDGLLNNPSVFVELLPVNANDLVSSDVQAMNVLAPLVTVAAAKVHTGSSRFDLTRGAVERASASAASKDQERLQEFYRNIPHPSEFVKGQLYEVEIPEDNDMLLWDKPLSEQPEGVRRALSGYAPPSVESRMQEGFSRAEAEADYKKASRIFEGTLGKDFYGQGLPPSKAKERSLELAALGIKGIKYLDGTSRATGDGSYNYVIFSGDDVAIQQTFFSRADEIEPDARRAGRAVSGSPEPAQFGFEVGSENHLSTLRPVDVFGNGSRIEYYDDAKGMMYSSQRYPTGLRWTAWDVLPKSEGGNQVVGEMDRHRSFSDAVSAVRGARISAAAKARNAKYGAIPRTWDGDAKKLGKALIDAGVGIDRFVSSAQSKSKYVYLDSGKKIRLSDHSLPSAYDAPDYDFRYGGDIKSLVQEVVNDQSAPDADGAAFARAQDQAQTPEFRAWFGDSKVVDPYGRPLRVYHGSVGKRTVFESHWRQLERDALPHELIGSGSIAQIYKQAKEEPELHFFAALRDTAETYGPDVTEAYLQIANMVGNPDMASHEAIELMLQLDADGAIFRETTSSGAYGGVAYVVRKSSQIKSAVDNMGAFDPGEADIRLSRDIPGIGAGEGGHIRSALKQAYGTLLEQLESASLVRLNRNLEAALDAAAQARSLRSGVDVAQERQMLASHMLASHTFAGHAPAGHAPAGHAPAGYVTSAAGVDVKRSAAGDIQGFFDPVAQQAYLIEEHLTPSSAPGVLMHEIGVHMAYDRADSPQQRQLMRAFVRARQILSEGAQHTSDPGLAAAIQQASNRMSDAGETSAEEAAAYLVEAIENHRIRHLAAQQDPSNLGEVLGGWLQETASSVRAWLFSKGVLIDAQDLTAYDIAALARGKAHNLASESSSNRLRKDLTRSLDHALTMAGTRARRFSLRVAEIINPPHQPLGLYSALQSEVGSVRASALTATGWKDVVAGWVNKGTVKSAEVEWSGLVEWLDLQDGQSGRVSRQEVMTYLMAHGVRVEEVERTEKTVIPQKERVGQLEPQAEAGSGPKYQRYTLPGGSNYREVLLKLPARPGRHTLRFADGKHRIWSNDKQDWARRPDGVLLRSYDSEADGLRAMGVMGGAHSRNFCDNHWGEVNVLAHLRLDDRIDAEGRKTLFVEEVQSDWGQIGKRGGFAKIGSGDPSGIQLGSVPDAPFVTKTEGWLSLALKRVLVMAAEGGYEAVAFISGEQSAARYDLSKQIDRAHIARTDDAWAVHAWKNGTKVITRVASKNDELQEIIGKDLAERAIADGGGEYQGLDLQVGGKGMRAFYDVILPNTLKSIFKKIGTGKLDSVRFGDGRSYDETQALLNDYAAYPIGSSDRQALLDYLDVAPDYGYSSIRGTQTGFAVTDDLREKVSHGLPLFSRRGLADADLDADDRSRCNPEARDDLEPDEHQKSDLAPRC